MVHSISNADFVISALVVDNNIILAGFVFSYTIILSLRKISPAANTF